MIILSLGYRHLSNFYVFLALTVSVPYPGGTTALHLATKNRHNNCVKELILNGADYNQTNQHGHTSLYIAAQQGYEDLVLIHLDNAVGRDILSLPVQDTGNFFLDLLCYILDRERA